MPPKKQQGRVRIVGGSLGGRLLTVPEGARPTPARARETLFNWLAPLVPGARCLDLFAGAGALGIEALSRGAAECLFVDSGREAARMLRGVLAHWALPGGVERADAVEWLTRSRRAAGGSMDIVFLDPPFASGLGARCCTLLAVNGWLAENCRVYLETHKQDALTELPPGIEALRETTIGDVRLVLAGWSGSR